MKTSKPVKGRQGPAVVKLTTAELAKRWGMAPRTLANWRSAGTGPAFEKTPGTRESIRYPLPAVLEFETANTIKPRR
jgi:hypothetical protein